MGLFSKLVTDNANVTNNYAYGPNVLLEMYHFVYKSLYRKFSFLEPNTHMPTCRHSNTPHRDNMSTVCLSKEASNVFRTSRAPGGGGGGGGEKERQMSHPKSYTAKAIAYGFSTG